MATERPDADDTSAWLDGLAGRDAESPAAREGASIRKALVGPDLKAEPPPSGWGRVVGAAGGAGRALPANEGDFRPWRWGIAASLVLAGGLVFWQYAPLGEDSQLRGTANAAGMLWLTPTPRESSEQLQTELQALGATVVLTPVGDGFRLHVQSPEAGRAAVNARLAEIEAALDARGQADIAVRARPAASPSR